MIEVMTYPLTRGEEARLPSTLAHWPALVQAAGRALALDRGGLISSVRVVLPAVASFSLARLVAECACRNLDVEIAEGDERASGYVALTVRRRTTPTGETGAARRPHHIVGRCRRR